MTSLALAEADTAQSLWNARVTGHQLPADFAGAPVTVDDAYRIQAAMIYQSGYRVNGWKIGAVIEPSFAWLGVTEPFLGPVFSQFTYSTGKEVKVQPGYAVESEVTVRLDSELPARKSNYSRREVAAAIGSIIPAFEVVGARFDGELTGTGLKVIADGGGHVATILGPSIDDWSDLDLVGFEATLEINGEIVSTGTPTDLVWDHILDSISWLVSRPQMKNRGLLAGDIIMTGSCTGVTPVAAGDHAIARFGDWGEVHAHFA